MSLLDHLVVFPFMNCVDSVREGTWWYDSNKQEDILNCHDQSKEL